MHEALHLMKHPMVLGYYSSIEDRSDSSSNKSSSSDSNSNNNSNGKVMESEAGQMVGLDSTSSEVAVYVQQQLSKLPSSKHMYAQSSCGGQ